jgi:tripeptidyl-peptidase-1
MKLGLQGISIFYAAGDSGVSGPPGDDSDNGCLGDNSKVFSPAWPNK